MAHLRIRCSGQQTKDLRDLKMRSWTIAGFLQTGRRRLCIVLYRILRCLDVEGCSFLRAPYYTMRLQGGKPAPVVLTILTHYSRKEQLPARRDTAQDGRKAARNSFNKASEIWPCQFQKENARPLHAARTCTSTSFTAPKSKATRPAETGLLFANSATDRHSDFLETLQEGIELTDPASLQRHPQTSDSPEHARNATRSYCIEAHVVRYSSWFIWTRYAGTALLKLDSTQLCANHPAHSSQHESTPQYATYVDILLFKTTHRNLRPDLC